MIGALLRRFQPESSAGFVSGAGRHPSLGSLPGVHILAAAAAGVALGALSVGVTYLPGKWMPLFALAALALCFLMIVQKVQRVLLFLVILDIPLQLDSNLFYRQEAASLGAVGGVTIALTTFCLVGLYALWGAQAAATRDTPGWRWQSMPLPLALYLLVSLLTIVVAYDRALVLYQLALQAQMFLLYVYVVGTVRTREDVRFVVVAMLMALLIESVIIIGLRFVGTTVRFSGITFLVNGTRVSGTVGSPNSAGAYLSLTLAPATAAIFTAQGRAFKWLAGTSAVLGTLALLFTLSRGAWVAYALGTGFIVLMAGRRGWISIRRAMLLLLVALLVVSLMSIIILPRVLGSDRGAAYTRIPLMEIAFRIIQDHPFFGVGANNVAIVTPAYFTPEYGEAWVYAVHNMYLRIWSETGLGGLLVYLAFLLLTLRWGRRAYAQGDAFLAPLALGFSAGVMGHMAHMMFDTFHSRPNVQALWLSAAMIGALYLIGVHAPAHDGTPG